MPTLDHDDDALLEVPGMMYEESRANLLAMRDRELSLPALSSVHLQSMLREEPYVQGLASPFETGMNIVKAVMGAAVFAIPHVFMKMGVLGGSIVTIVLALLTAYSMMLLLEAKMMVARETMQQYVRYVDIARHAFGPSGATLLFVLTVLASLGVAAANLTFVGTTIVDILQMDYSVPAPGHATNVLATWADSAWMFTVGALVVITPLTWLRSFKVLAYASILGNVCLLAGILGVIGFGFSELHRFHRVDAINFAELPKSAGTISFVFCINFLLLPIERSMHRHAPFKKILYVSFTGVTLFIVVFSILAYALFQDGTCINVLYNLNLKDRGAKMGGTALKIALCIAQLTSYPLTMSPACETFELMLLTKKTVNRSHKRRAIRFALILVTVAMAQIRSFALITNLLGGLTSLPLSLILPPALYLKLGRDSKIKAHMLVYSELHGLRRGASGKAEAEADAGSIGSAASAAIPVGAPDRQTRSQPRKEAYALSRSMPARYHHPFPLSRQEQQLKSNRASASKPSTNDGEGQGEEEEHAGDRENNVVGGSTISEDCRLLEGDVSDLSRAVSPEDIGMVPSKREVWGAWFVLVCGTFITVVTIAYTLQSIITPDNEDCANFVPFLVPNASNHTNRSEDGGSRWSFGPYTSSQVELYAS